MSGPASLAGGASRDGGVGTLGRVGPVLFAIALLGMGMQCVVTGAPVPGLERLPPSLTAAARAIAYPSGLALLGGGAAVLVGPGRARGPLLAFGALFFTWAVALHLPALVARPADGTVWTRAFESAAIGGAAWVLLRRSREIASDTTKAAPSVSAPVAIGRVAFAVALLVFGGLHLVFRQFVAPLVPAWIPGRMFWAVLTGAAFLASGFSLLSGVLARAAAACVGAMFGAWVLIVHAPRVVRTPSDPKEWGSMLVALAMCGGAWLIAGRIVPARTRGRTPAAGAGAHSLSRPASPPLSPAGAPDARPSVRSPLSPPPADETTI